SEAKRLELERKLMEYTKSDAYLVKLKYMKLTKYLKEIDGRQQEALLRNQTFLKEFNQFETRVKASSSAMIQKMEAWYRREIKSVLSRGEGNLSAEGGEEEGCSEQVSQVGRQAGISTEITMPEGLYHPATVFMGHHTSAVSAAGGLDTWQKALRPTESCSAPDPPLCSPSHEGLGPESRNIDLECDASVEGAMRHQDPAASEEGSEQVFSSACDPKPGSPEEERPQGSVPALPAASWEQDRIAPAAEDSSQQPPNPPAGQEEPLVSSAPDGFCNWAGSLKEDDLEAGEAVVLHQLRALLPDPPWDADALRTRLSHHALFLRKHQVQLPAEVAGMFERLLLSSEKARDGQALRVLREALPEERGDSSSVQSDESSSSLPAIPNDGGEIEQADPAPRLAGAAERGCESGDNGSEATASHEEPSEAGSSSQGRSPPFSRAGSRKGTATAVKSKAFWGESDDSSSEVEAALRPQTHSSEADDFDDFYD
ncbi:KIZ protein, partial [Eurystomus gularis]|nr:KIZ protein [Eurystomus gularis]